MIRRAGDADGPDDRAVEHDGHRDAGQYANQGSGLVGVVARGHAALHDARGFVDRAHPGDVAAADDMRILVGDQHVVAENAGCFVGDLSGELGRQDRRIHGSPRTLHTILRTIASGLVRYIQ